MIYHVKVLKGLVKPQRSFYQLNIAEEIQGLRFRVGLLAVVSMMLFTIGAGFGVGSESISHELTKLSPQDFALRKQLFVFGQAIVGLAYAGVILFIPSLFFKMFTETTYHKLVILQLYVLPILLLEKAVSILLAIWAGLPWFSSPLSLGVIVQPMTDQRFLIYFLGSITIFHIWVMIVQYKGLRLLSREVDTKNIFLMVLGIHLLFWILHAVYPLIFANLTEGM